MVGPERSTSRRTDHPTRRGEQGQEFGLVPAFEAVRPRIGGRSIMLPVQQTSDLGHPRVGARVRGQELRRPAVRRRVLEHIHHVQERPRVVSAPGHVAKPELVRLQLLVAPEMEQVPLPANADDDRHAVLDDVLVGPARAQSCRDDPELHEQLLRDPFVGVLGGDVSDLVPDDAGELCLARKS